MSSRCSQRAPNPSFKLSVHFPVEEPGFSQLENAALKFLHRVSAQAKGRAQPIAAGVK